MSSVEPLLPTTEADVASKKKAFLSDLPLIFIGAILLTIGAILIKVFPTSLPAQYGSPATSCSQGQTLKQMQPDIRPTAAQGQYFWAQQKGNSNKTGYSSVLSPDCMSHSPAWKWADPLGTVLRATPVIDDKKNVYLTLVDARVLKFDEFGSILWSYQQVNDSFPAVPALLRGMMIQSSVLGFVVALDMETGKELWKTRVANSTAGDTAGILVVDDVIVLGCASIGQAGNTQVVALTHDGIIKWRFTLQPSFRIYNFQAASPGDGTVVFMDSSGGLYRLSLASGATIWESGIVDRKPPQQNLGVDFSFHFKWFSTGAAVIGPNNVVYCSSNLGKQGIFHAYNLEDGKPLWRTDVELSANTGLAVGYLGGSSELAVVGGVGMNPGIVTFAKVLVYSVFLLPVAICVCSCFLCRRWRKKAQQGRSPHCAWRLFVWVLMVIFLMAIFSEFAVGANSLSVNCKDTPNWLFLTRPYRQKVVALNAADGSPRWSYELPAFSRAAAAGDEERFFTRLASVFAGSTGGPFCLPDSFNQAVINGQGSVYIGHEDGRLYSIRDSNSDGHINSYDEVSYYNFGDAFQAGVGIAPGLLAVVPCGGGLFVWKSDL